MKTKNKMIVVVEIAVVLCSLFLVALPAVAAQEQNQGMQKVSASAITTASEDDYVLGVYSNANEDDTIDMGDVVYTKLAIFGKKPKTELCDAKYDGRINVLDVIQTKLIILGKEKELTFVDSSRTAVTIKKPLKRIAVPSYTLETLRSIKVPKNIIAGVSKLNPIFFPEFSDVPVIGSDRYGFDVEAALSLNPDAVFYRGYMINPAYRTAYEKAGIPVIVFDPNRLTNFTQIMRIHGYMFDKREEVEEFLDFHDGIRNMIKERMAEIPEEDKPKVYYESTSSWSTHRYPFSLIDVTGGRDIFDGAGGKVDPEAVIDRSPDIIVKTTSLTHYTGVSSAYALDVGDTAHYEEKWEEIMSREPLKNVEAVKNKRVYVIDATLLNFAPGCGVRQFLQQVYFAKWFQPELFEDLDPRAIHQEYLTRFQGLDIDLDEKGVFVYHQEEHPDGH